MTRERATAFVPGHVTAFFSAYPAADPAAAGSCGAGVTLTHGVETTVVPRDRSLPLDRTETADGSTPPVLLDGTPVAIDVVGDVLAALGVTSDTAEVRLASDLPVGAGFGVSGAAALGAALAANAAFDLGRSENELIRIAHVAEVERGTGLGDVVAQARGGIPIRVRPGAPAHGELDGIPTAPRVEYVTFGELSTEAVLAGDTDALSAAGERALTRLRRDTRSVTLLAAARTFAVEADLLVPAVEEAIDAVAAAGGSAAMAMLGRTVFAFGTGLSDAGYDPAVCGVHAAGAGIVNDDAPATDRSVSADR
ncbi:pantoate kinase [Halorubrum vacuolatum]|uniref:Pantoate kinase n=1 Tax=Halorubrum vacuolatum TaxID=63740 RepID=A0A238X693_HALVU|nr:sugar kinase [Halorubrum vacuolatum]SNR53864.1 pantothenate kinase [Halorubrum vacuolatum]